MRAACARAAVHSIARSPNVPPPPGALPCPPPRERAGLRTEGDCGFVKLASFGMLEFDWRARTLAMQIRKAEAPGAGSVLQQLTISLDTCLPV